MRMLVSLFDSQMILSNINKVSEQVETRKFHIQEERFNKFLNTCEDSGLKEKVLALKEIRRGYKKVFGSSSDNLYLLERLGLGDSAREYTVELDFSLNLDLVLYVMTGASPENLRNVPFYTEFSNALLRYQPEILDKYIFSDLFKIDPELDAYFMQLFFKVYGEEDTEKVHAFIFNFYRDVLSTLVKIKTYVFLSLKEKYPTLVMRSKDFATILCTMDSPITDKITIQFNNEEFPLHVVNINNYTLEVS